MRSLLPRVCLAVSLTLGFSACGELPPDEESIELSELGGLDVPADYAGDLYVKVKGALTLARSKKGTLTSRDRYHGYTLTAKRGETLRVRGVTSGVMSLVSIYGLQVADGKWGTQLVKRWTYRALERSVPVLEHKTAKAGKYLVVIGTTYLDATTTTDYAVTACDGVCTANACVELLHGPSSPYHAGVNFLTRAEAEVGLGDRPASAFTLRTGSCGEQSRTCPRTRAPVCASITGKRGSATYDNFCHAKGALFDAMGDKIGAPKMLHAPAGACE